MSKGRSSAAPQSRSLAGNAALLVIGSVFTQAAAILTLSALARLVPKDQLGTYQQLSLLYGIVSPLLLGGIPAGLLYFLGRARDDRERREWIYQSYSVLAAFGLVSSGLVILLRHPVADLFSNPDLAPALTRYAPYLFFAFIASATPNALVAAGYGARAATNNAAGGACMLVGAVGAALVEPNANTLALGLSGGAAVWAAISIVGVWRNIGVAHPRRGSLASRRELLGYGGPLALSGVAARIGYQFDRIVISANFSASQFAIYALGAVEIPISLLVQQAVGSVLVPELSRRWSVDDIPGMLSLWREAIRKSSLIVAPMFAFLILNADDVIHVLYGPGFEECVTIFQIYLLFLPLRVATFGAIPQAIGRTRLNFGAAVIILVLNVGLALALVGPFGLKGPAIAAPVATLAATVYYLWCTCRILGVGIGDLMPFRQLANTFLVCLAAGALSLPLHAVSVPALARLVMTGIAFLVLCGAGLRLARQLTDDDLARLRAIARRLLPQGERPRSDLL